MYVIYKCIKYCILFIIIYDHLYIISNIMIIIKPLIFPIHEKLKISIIQR